MIGNQNSPRASTALLVGVLLSAATAFGAEDVIVNHSCADLSRIPGKWIEKAKRDLHIAYGHTSHGSQLTSGMTGLARFKGDRFAWNSGGGTGALDLRDRAMRGANDLGNPDRRAWAAATRAYLDANPEINVVIWSWCGQASTSTANIDIYLTLMEKLIRDYPKVRFVFMTGHLNGGGLRGSLHLANEHIRKHCKAKGRLLYDFADIESYDPDGNHFGDKLANDNCDYDSDGDGKRDRNWARDWQDTHEKDVDWYACPSAHSQPLNANRKAYAAWWLWARLAGWSGGSATPPPTPEELKAAIRAGEEAEARGDKVEAYVHYREAVAAAGRMPDQAPEMARAIRAIKLTKLRALEKDEAVRAEKRAYARFDRCLRSSLREVTKIAENHAGTPSGRRAAELARRLRDLIENRTGRRAR